MGETIKKTTSPTDSWPFHSGPNATYGTLVGHAVMWLVAAVRSLTSFGWSRLFPPMALQALGIGLRMPLIVPLLAILASTVISIGHAS